MSQINHEFEWGQWLVGTGIGIIGVFIVLLIRKMPTIVSAFSIVLGTTCILVGTFFLFDDWGRVDQVKPKVAPIPTPTSPPVQPIPTRSDTAGNEQKVYSEAIRCLYATCDSSTCIEPFRRTFPSSGLLPLLELTATNAQTSPACKKTPPMPPQVAKPFRVPDCNSKDIQQSMVPIVTRWFERSAMQTNALSGHAAHFQDIQILTVYSQFAGICNVMAVGTLVEGNRGNKFPSDGLVVELSYDDNGAVVMQTLDGVK